MSASWRCVLVLGLLCVRAPTMPRAWAQPSPSMDADAHLERGQAHFEAKDYAAAGREFSAAYDLDPRPEFLYARAQAERLNGNCADAVPLYRAYLDTEPDQEAADFARTNLAQCAAAVPEDEPPARPPDDRELVDHRPPAWFKNRLGGALVGSGVVGLGLGLAWYRGARSDEAELARGLTSYQEHARLADRSQQRRDRANIATAAGSVLAVAGIVRYVWVARHRSRARRIAIVPALGQIVLTGEF